MSLPSKYAIEWAIQTPALGGSAGPIAAQNGGSGGGSAPPALGSITAASVVGHTLVGQHLGRHRRADLAERLSIGPVPVKGNRRAERKKKLTAVSSSRWAGAMTRANEDQYQLGMRCLYDERAGLHRAIKKITHRLTVPCGRRTGRVRGYQDQGERFDKQRRLQVLQARPAVVEQHITEGRPAVVVGGRRLAKMRHNLAEAQLTAEDWRGRWDAARLFSPLTASPVPRTATTPSRWTRPTAA